MDNPSKKEVLNQLSEFIELSRHPLRVTRVSPLFLERSSQSNSELDTVFVKLLENDDFLKRFYVYLVFRIKREHQGLISLIESNFIDIIESNSINNQTTDIMAGIMLSQK